MSIKLAEIAVTKALHFPKSVVEMRIINLII